MLLSIEFTTIDKFYLNISAFEINLFRFGYFWKEMYPLSAFLHNSVAHESFKNELKMAYVFKNSILVYLETKFLTYTLLFRFFSWKNFYDNIFFPSSFLLSECDRENTRSFFTHFFFFFFHSPIFSNFITAFLHFFYDNNVKANLNIFTAF